MYTLCVRRDFVAQHYLMGDGSGPETRWHSHHYQIEILLEGDSLNQQGYLIDIIAVGDQLETLLSSFRDRTLNEMPEFEGLNPSLEQFARVFCHLLTNRIETPNLAAIEVKLWEDERTWASYRQKF